MKKILIATACFVVSAALILVGGVLSGEVTETDPMEFKTWSDSLPFILMASALGGGGLMAAKGFYVIGGNPDFVVKDDAGTVWHHPVAPRWPWNWLAYLFGIPGALYLGGAVLSAAFTLLNG